MKREIAGGKERLQEERRDCRRKEEEEVSFEWERGNVHYGGVGADHEE